MIGMPESTLYRAEGLDPLVAGFDEGRLVATLDEVMLEWSFVSAGQGATGA